MKKNYFPRFRRSFSLLPAILLFSLALTSCGSKSTASSGAASFAVTANGMGTGGDAAGVAETAADITAQAGYSLSSSPGISSAEETDVSAPMERKLIRTVNMNVETLDFDSLLTSIQENVSRLDGYIEQSDISGNSITSGGRVSTRYSSMTIRIPAENLSEFVTEVETNGNVTYKSENLSDVTLQYSDVESRLKTLRTEQERLWELLAIADTTESIIALEERLTEVTIDIETSESRLRSLDNSITYSTIYLSINEVKTESPTQPETIFQQIRRGFSQNLDSLFSFLTGAFVSILSGSPTLLFLLVLFLVLRLAVKKFSGKLPRRRRKKTDKPEEPGDSHPDQPDDTP